VGHCGAEISNKFICTKFSNFAPEGLEITLFQNGCLAFGSPANSNLYLKLKISMTSASFQALPGDLQTAASSTSLLPIVMQIPVTSIETCEGRSKWLLVMPSLAATAVRLFFLESGQFDKYYNSE
jgi:hypothetical protein